MARASSKQKNIQKYPLAIRVIHWFMALSILGLIVVGYYMTGLSKDDPSRGDMYNLHKSFGSLVLILVIIRLSVRIFTKVPPLPKAIPDKEKKAAAAAHILLYALMFSVPILGFAMSNGYGYPVHLFALEMPVLFEKNIELAKLANEWHEIMAYVLLAIVGLHFAGAMKHRFMDKKENDVLGRML